jgi:predicted membrane protein
MNETGELLIAWSEFLGGVVGLLVLLPIAAIQRVAPLGPAYYLGAGLGFIFAIIAGWRLLRRQSLGRELSLIVQLLQVVQITALGWIVQYATGLQVLVKVRPDMFQVSPGVNAAVWFGPTLVPVPWVIGINLFALWASIHLARKLATKRVLAGNLSNGAADEPAVSSIGPA